MRSPTDIAYFSFPRRALSSLFSPRSLSHMPRVKRIPEMRHVAECLIILSRWRTKKTAGKKERGKTRYIKERRTSKNSARERKRRRGGRVTLRSIEQGNTIKVVRSPEAWRDANPVFHSSSPSLFFLRFRETSTRALRVAQKHPSL